MQFESASHKACYEKIAPWMKEIFGTFVAAPPEAPVFGVFIGSTVAQVAVFPWGDNDTTICSRAYVCMGAELRPDLLLYLLQENSKMRFGAFGVDPDGDIFFEHTIVGSSCDKGELESSVKAVAFTADRYDDEIVSKWGGQRPADRAMK